MLPLSTLQEEVYSLFADQTEESIIDCNNFLRTVMALLVSQLPMKHQYYDVSRKIM